MYYTTIYMAKKKTSDKLSKEQKEALEEEIEKRFQQKLAREAREFKKEFAKNTFKLMTSGFGLVAALAWNDFVKEFIALYIQPFFGKDSALVSMLIYAVAVTFLAVLVTYNLGKIAGESKKD